MKFKIHSTTPEPSIESKQDYPIGQNCMRHFVRKKALRSWRREAGAQPNRPVPMNCLKLIRKRNIQITKKFKFQTILQAFRSLQGFVGRHLTWSDLNFMKLDSLIILK
ncbi:hypothetical protein C0J52_27691 [Blattella germanica]|nr:hypothetical protein C0J52_27691 [Blattella germanica]